MTEGVCGSQMVGSEDEDGDESGDGERESVVLAPERKVPRNDPSFDVPEVGFTLRPEGAVVEERGRVCVEALCPLGGRGGPEVGGMKGRIAGGEEEEEDGDDPAIESSIDVMLRLLLLLCHSSLLFGRCGRGGSDPKTSVEARAELEGAAGRRGGDEEETDVAAGGLGRGT